MAADSTRRIRHDGRDRTSRPRCARHACGELRAERRRRARSTLCGWVAHRRDHGGVTFIDLRDREGVVQVVFHPEEAPEAHAVAQDLRGRGRGARDGRGPRCGPTGMVNPELATGEVEVAADRARGAARVRHAAVPDRGPGRGRRGAPPRVPLPRPAPARDDARSCGSGTRRRERCASTWTRSASSRSRRRCSREHARGRARLPRAVAAAAGHVLRAAAVAAAAEAAPDGRRAGPLLPDRPLPPRRGPARRPRASSSRSSTSRCRSSTRRTSSR